MQKRHLLDGDTVNAKPLTWHLEDSQVAQYFESTPAADHRLRRAPHHGHLTDPDKEPTMATLTPSRFLKDLANA